ncbi:HET-domain-containing protein [Bimuria novae-zelandiae CBS 107.79]|uniref:HET-domain-containing protein n=1 Tax=Bimuria novae-zelandiae CBS 107.79 TaxID=1447943 RepID=A0A6A5VNJ2_9PLEO|nr:HET-domain-containing protein [Bimuria novae-zelandiae CBS 107.79]
MVAGSKHRRKSLSVIPQATASLASSWATSPDDRPTCDVCRDLKTQGDGFSFSIGELSVSQHDCRACSVLSTILNPFNLSPQDKIHGYDGPMDTLRVFFRTSEDVKLSVYHRPLLWSESCPWPSIKPSPHPRKFSAGTAVYRIAQWLKECDDSHALCIDSSRERRLPTRVLHIVGPRQIRLLATESDLQARYACLSHCWGSTTPIRTTTSNITALEGGITWEKLPTTFQDAVEVTRGLGLQYLWIDSLCIVQDDLEDWRHEGAKMASIYAQAYVTLAATKSSDSSGGFHPELSAAPDPLSYKFFKNLRNPFTLHVVRSGDHSKYFREDLPLLKRAWVFQERLLSRRTVHFADQEMYYECNTGTSCECGEYKSDFFHNKGLQKHKFVKLTQQTSYYDRTEENTDLSKMWRQLVSTYSRLALTHETDIFPALQGVVKQIQKVRMCAYFAGIWEDDIIRDLCWFYKSPSSTKRNHYRAPSWSWASQRGSVEWIAGGANYYNKAHVVSVSTEPMGEDHTGQLKAGQLVLRGPCVDLLSFTCSIDNGRFQSIKFRRRGEKTEISKDGLDTVIHFDSRENWHTNPNGRDEVEYPELRVMQVHPWAYLLLEKIPAQEGLYKRVGIAPSWFWIEFFRALDDDDIGGADVDSVTII